MLITSWVTSKLVRRPYRKIRFSARYLFAAAFTKCSASRRCLVGAHHGWRTPPSSPATRRRPDSDARSYGLCPQRAALRYISLRSPRSLRTYLLHLLWCPAETPSSRRSFLQQNQISISLGEYWISCEHEYGSQSLLQSDSFDYSYSSRRSLYALQCC